MGETEPNFRNFKMRGEYVEMLFMARASRDGLQVSKPYGDSAAYDFIVEFGTLCSRIQVKSTLARSSNGFVCCMRGSAKYKLASFDFAAVYVIPSNAWFIVPRAGLPVCMFLMPGRKGSKYHPYEEAWHLLKPPAEPGEIANLLAFADL
jgi:hypothetical protein